MAKRILVALLLVAALAVAVVPGQGVSAAGTTYYVNAASGDNNNDCTSPGTACKTINAAIGKASAGDTIVVAAGTYGERVDVNKSLALQGAQSGVDARTRDADLSDESVITEGFHVTAGNVTLDGFTVQGADKVAPDFGTGIHLSASASGYTIINNIIQDNVFGLYLNSDGDIQSVVRFNLFKANNRPGSASGDGIYTDQGAHNILIESNRFTGHNSAAMVFAGSAQSDITISNNELVNDNAIVLFDTTNAVIKNNTSSTPQGSGIVLGGGNDGITIRGNRITGGVSQAVSIPSPSVFNRPANSNKNIQILGNDLSGNTDYGVRIAADALGGPVTVAFNRIVGNSKAGIVSDSDTTINAENNWWGCNEGPGSTGCDGVSGNIDYDPWLTLTATADPAQLSPEGTSQITASLTENSAGVDTSGQGHVPDGIRVDLSTTAGTIGSNSASTVDGKATTTFTATAFPGSATVTATVDNAQATAEVTWSAPASQPRERVFALGLSRDRFVVVSATTDRFGNVHGTLIYRDGEVSLFGARFTSLVTDGNSATLYGTARVGREWMTFRLDLTEGWNGTIRLRLSDGYDSGPQPLGSVLISS